MTSSPALGAGITPALGNPALGNEYSRKRRSFIYPEFIRDEKLEPDEINRLNDFLKDHYGIDPIMMYEETVANAIDNFFSKFLVSIFRNALFGGRRSGKKGKAFKVRNTPRAKTSGRRGRRARVGSSGGTAPTGNSSRTPAFPKQVTPVRPKTRVVEGLQYSPDADGRYAGLSAGPLSDGNPNYKIGEFVARRRDPKMEIEMAAAKETIRRLAHAKPDNALSTSLSDTRHGILRSYVRFPGGPIETNEGILRRAILRSVAKKPNPYGEKETDVEDTGVHTDEFSTAPDAYNGYERPNFWKSSAIAGIPQTGPRYR